MGAFLNKLFRVDERRLKKIELEAQEVLKFEEEMANLSDTELQAKTTYFKDLLELLNNEKFENFIVTTHARMRFIDRFIFDNENWKGKTSKTLKSITTRAINKLENSLEKSAYLQFINYCTDKTIPSEKAKYGARINFFNDTIIGLDENGHIHTMF